LFYLKKKSFAGARALAGLPLVPPLLVGYGILAKYEFEFFNESKPH